MEKGVSNVYCLDLLKWSKIKTNSFCWRLIVPLWSSFVQINQLRSTILSINLCRYLWLRQTWSINLKSLGGLESGKWRWFWKSESFKTNVSVLFKSGHLLLPHPFLSLSFSGREWVRKKEREREERECGRLGYSFSHQGLLFLLWLTVKVATYIERDPLSQPQL